MPLVTIVLTLHNIKAQYVRECLDSIRKQSFEDWQILAIDDYSTNQDYSFLENESKTIYVRNGINLGLSKTLNKAFSLINSEFIIRIGSDDIILPDLLKNEVEFLNTHKEYVAVCCELQKFGFSNILIKRPEHWIKQHNISSEPLINSYHGYGYAGGLMFRSSALKHCKINENYSICEDFDFHLQLLDVGKIKSIHFPYYLYRSHETNLCKLHGKQSKRKILFQILDSHNLIHV